MQASQHQTAFYQAFTLNSIQSDSLCETLKFQIDKNLCLKLTLKTIKGALLFRGNILYRNGLQLTLNQKSWKLVSNYSQLKKSNLMFSYDFKQQIVNISSKITFHPHLRPTVKFIYEHFVNIIKHVKSFISTLYRYNILSFSNKFSFSQFFEEAKLKRKLCLQLRHGIKTSQIPNTNPSSTPSEMIDEKQDPQPSSSIQQRIIRQCSVDEIKQTPQKLSGGPKNLSFHFRDQIPRSIICGGFFEIEKLLCCVQKKLQNSDKSNLKSVDQNGVVTVQKIGDEKTEDLKKYDILVRKTLKQARKEHEYNRLKISKQLIIVQQIKEKKHLLTYFKNHTKPCPEKNPAISAISEVTRDSASSSIMLNEQANGEKAEKQQQKKFKYATEIYMQFHAHTLRDFIVKQNRSMNQTLDACLQLLEATVHLHQSGVIHRDIKPENVLMDYETHRNHQIVKLIDFSESAIQTEAKLNPELLQREKQAISQIFEKFNSRLHGATLPYSPAECQYQRSERTSPGVNSYKIDSWSMGMILPEIYHGKKLVNFPRPYADDIINLIKDSGFESHFSRVNKKGFNIGQALITYMAMKNTFYNQDLRLDVGRSYNAFRILNTQMSKWQDRIKKQSQKFKFQYSKA